MKKIISLTLALMLLLGILAVPALAEDYKVGTLSYLNMTEEEENLLGSVLRANPVKILVLNGVFKSEGDWHFSDTPSTHHYDTLSALLMGLQAGEVEAIRVPYYTAKYLCSTNDTLKLTMEYHPENATELSNEALARLSDGYSFMLKEEDVSLRDEIDAQISAMKEDGTLQKLIDEYIIKASESGETIAVDFEQFEGEPIRVGVTGDLPPMDYVSADGSFAGFNTAVLAEIGKRLQKNIELVQVENVGRSLALSEGVVDVVFWTRALSETLSEHRAAGEKADDSTARNQDSMTDEEKAIRDKMESPDQETIEKLQARDMSPGTIITQPYFSDLPVWVALK